ncbi:hemolysin family protein [Rubrobacter indicoceani]|uniref:hemolysin family protein n=1 Tax=Rubrobacter indicoceani TaxID=2051957 RepID=UPI000E5A8F83|nr:hemolysin family protein [Rubrobacter indicoceani]
MLRAIHRPDEICKTRKGVELEAIVLPALRIIAALALVALNGLFVAAEFAFVRIRETQVDRLVREGKTSSGLVKTATDKLDQYLAVCQLGITICSLGIGALAEPAIASLIEPWIVAAGIPIAFTHPIAIAIALFIASFFHVVFGELAPKTLAIQRPERTSLAVSPFMVFFYYLLRPFVIFFNGTANAITGAFGVPPASEGSQSHSEEEIRMLVRQSASKGLLDADEDEMIGAVFELNDKMAREIMVPRPDVVALPASMDLKNLVSASASGHYTRYPVYEDDAPERAIGMIHAKDVLRAVEAAGSLESEITARDMLRDVLVVPENRKIDEILEDFQNQEIQMAIVVDEWGSFEGVFTIEDIIEEIVGEIRDEFDEEEPAVKQLSNGSFTIDGRIPINVVNDALGTNFESDDFDTIGGLVLGHIGRQPEVGDRVELDGHTLKVDDTDGARVAQVIACASAQSSVLDEDDGKKE